MSTSPFMIRKRPRPRRYHCASITALITKLPQEHAQIEALAPPENLTARLRNPRGSEPVDAAIRPHNHVPPLRKQWSGVASDADVDLFVIEGRLAM